MTYPAEFSNHIKFDKYVISTFILLSFVACFFLSLVSCFKSSQVTQVMQSGTLKLITRNSPATYFYTHEQERGFEYELAKRFADFLGVKLTVEVATNLTDLNHRLNNSDTPAIAAAGLVLDHSLQDVAKTSVGFMPLTSQVVYHKKKRKPKKIEDLANYKIKVIKDSHQSYFLANLQLLHPNITFTQESYEVADLLAELDNGKFDLALVNSTELAFSQFSFVNIRNSFVAEDNLSLVWATSKYSDNSLLKQVNIFFDQISNDGTLAQLTTSYYQHTKVMSYVGVNAFTKHLQTRLPLYKQYFKQAADKYDVDWRLLAAIGYQESQWLPDATSKTGVRGLMMLTQNTADDMGVKNRLDPQQSILGGAKYFTQIKKSLNENILEPNRTWLALASYNVGLGHMLDARSLAKREGLDDNEWQNVRKMLFRLKQYKWHTKTKYGYARGGEAVHFAQNVQRYYDILTWYTFQDDVYPSNI